MNVRWLWSALLSLAVAGQLSAQEPTLEELEKVSADLDGPPLPEEARPAPLPIIQRPASDASFAEAIDIRSRIKKISEPNLFAGAAPTPGTLRNLASGEAPEEYVVQEGDNLSDICDQLIDEPNYWPKLWAFNPNITNPHFVYPGMRLRFYAGDNESPPFLQVITEDDVLPVSKGKIVEAELVQEDINGMLMRSEIPENMTILEPDELGEIKSIAGLFIDVGGKLDLDHKVVLIPAFVVEEEFEELGTVVGGAAGSLLVDRGQQVIVTQAQGLTLGSTYTVLRKGRPVHEMGLGAIGIRYEFVAQLRLSIQDKNDDKVFIGDIVFNRLGIQPGDILVAYRSVKREVPLKYEAEGKGLSQPVVGFTEAETQIGGRGDFVYIDQAQGKLKEKDVYTIVQNVKVASASFLRSQLPDTDSEIAEVYILDTAGAAAIGYILHDSLEVRIGDRVSPF